MSKETIRTLGLYQPFASLMLHGKIETRWVSRYRRPGFKKGKYLLYSTLKEFSFAEVEYLSNTDVLNNIERILKQEPTRWLKGYALCVADLVEVRLLTLEDEPMAFVNCIGAKVDIVNKKDVVKNQWALVFNNVTRIEPFQFKGKQGVGILHWAKHNLIKPI